MKNQKFELSTASIIKVIAIILGIWIAYYILDIIVMLFIVVLFSAALEPSVSRITKWGVPRVLSILLLYLVLGIIFGVAVYIVVPPLVSQISELALNAPEYIDKVTNFTAAQSAQTTQQILDSISLALTKFTEGFVGATIALFGGLVSVITILTLTFYILIEERGLRKTIVNSFPIKNRLKVAEIGHRIGVKIGLWLRAQLLLMLIIGLITTISLQIIGAPYAVTLGVLAGILEIVPVIGPIIAGLAAVLIVFASGAPLWQIIAIIVLYAVIQQLENQILVPKIMKRAIGVSPVVVILAILIGGELLGVGGAILAIPIVGVISVLMQEYYRDGKWQIDSE